MLGSLFSGIGALDLGIEHGLGAHPAWFVESDPYCRRVLARHWPDVERFEDVRQVGAATLAPVDCLVAGFPCQPASVAGKQRGKRDPRWLWPEVARIAAELSPPLCIFENVLGLRTAGMRDVLADLASLGFDVEWSDLSAFELGAPHLRRRLFFVAAHPQRIALREQPGWLARACRAARPRVDRFTIEASLAADAAIPGLSSPAPSERPRLCGAGDAAHTDSQRRLEQSWRIACLRGWPRHRGWGFDSAERVDDVPPRGLVTTMRRAAGNAVVTACAFVVGQATRDALDAQLESA